MPTETCFILSIKPDKHRFVGCVFCFVQKNRPYPNPEHRIYRRRVWNERDTLPTWSLVHYHPKEGNEKNDIEHLSYRLTAHIAVAPGPRVMCLPDFLRTFTDQ